MQQLKSKIISETKRQNHVSEMCSPLCIYMKPLCYDFENVYRTSGPFFCAMVRSSVERTMMMLSGLWKS